MERITSFLSRFAWLLGALIAAAGLKLWLFLANKLPFNADQAIDALMARHILSGERPIFFYGQEYMGSLDSWLLAAAFSLFGESLWVIALAEGLLYIGTVLTTAWIGWIIFEDRRVGFIAAWLLAIPAVNVAFYTSINMGVYGEILLLGNLTVLVGLWSGKELKSSRWPPWHMWALFGFISGFAFWALSLSLVYTVPVAIYLTATLLRFRREQLMPDLSWRDYAGASALVLGGAVIGSFPLWFYAIQNGFAEFAAELISNVSGASLMEQIVQHFVNFAILGIPVIFGIRPPWTLNWLVWPLIPFVITFWAGVLVWTVKAIRDRDERKPEKLIMWGIILTLVVGFIVSPFGRDPSGRYFLPLAIPLALFAGDLINALFTRYGRIAFALLALIMAYNLWGIYHGILSFPAGLTTRFDVVTAVNQKTIHDLVSFLQKHQETRGYTNYWVAYPLAFFSNEELVYVPRLPYHSDFSYTTRDNRYAPYNQIVASSSRIAYITTNFPDLDNYLRDKFARLGIAWNEEQIGDFHVFFNLSSPITVDEIGLGSDMPQ